MSTFSEAFQKKLQKKSCPYLQDCSINVTKDFFTRICKTTSYLNCHHFAKRMGELKTPISWLQKIAVDQAKMLEQHVETRSPQTT
jgi:hypothetical protein